MQNSEAVTLSAALLAVAGELTRRIHDGVVARGFEGVRPAHGFAFTRLAPDGATVTDLAVHLGVTKQAASQLVDELVRKGYAERRRHPADARARLVALTPEGRRRLEEQRAETFRRWRERLSAWDPDDVRQLATLMHRLGGILD